MVIVPGMHSGRRVEMGIQVKEELRSLVLIPPFYRMSADGSHQFLPRNRSGRSWEARLDRGVRDRLSDAMGLSGSS
jgi:hypothetical protein